KGLNPTKAIGKIKELMVRRAVWSAGACERVGVSMYAVAWNEDSRAATRRSFVIRNEWNGGGAVPIPSGRQACQYRANSAPENADATTA
ncbi:hypothetical protein, partial [Burkholderia cenocepacia]|uniref:hypothetical protein n=1 Tax=Burkholderia cenocepacia TaxID=95486 RepID=UPI002AB0D01C